MYEFHRYRRTIANGRKLDVYILRNYGHLMIRKLAQARSPSAYI